MEYDARNMSVPLAFLRGRRPGRWTGLLALTVSGLLDAGCTVALQTPAEQCTEDADCVALGEDFDGTVCIDRVCQPTAWVCVDQLEPLPANQDFEATIQLFDLLGNKPITDATVRLCQKLDPQCSAPVETLTPDEDGIVSTTVKTSFRGYFDVDAAGYRPTLYFIDTSSIRFPSTSPPTVTIFTPEASDALNKAITPTIDPEAGFVSVAMFDCDNARAAGVHFDITPDEGVNPFYAIESAVSGTATETDVTGSGGFINVPPGSVTLTATQASTGLVLATEITSVRKGTVTFQAMRPKAQE